MGEPVVPFRGPRKRQNGHYSYHASLRADYRCACPLQPRVCADLKTKTILWGTFISAHYPIHTSGQGWWFGRAGVCVVTTVVIEIDENHDCSRVNNVRRRPRISFVPSEKPSLVNGHTRRSVRADPPNRRLFYLPVKLLNGNGRRPSVFVQSFTRHRFLGSPVRGSARPSRHGDGYNKRFVRPICRIEQPPSDVYTCARTAYSLSVAGQRGGTGRRRT